MKYFIFLFLITAVTLAQTKDSSSFDAIRQNYPDLEIPISIVQVDTNIQPYWQGDKIIFPTSVYIDQIIEEAYKRTDKKLSQNKYLNKLKEISEELEWWIYEETHKEGS